MEEEKRNIMLETEETNKYIIKDDFIKDGQFIKIVFFENGKYIVDNETINNMIGKLDYKNDACIQIIGFLGVAD